jgi:hypothetical protein
MTPLRTSLRARLFVEHLEDRAQPALVATSPLANLAAFAPVANSAPALVSNPGASTSSEATLVIFFGPADVVEFAILVEPAQTVSVPPTTTTNHITESLLSETSLREFLATGEFQGVIETVSIVPLHEDLRPANPGPISPLVPKSAETTIPFVGNAPSDALATFLTPAGYLLATRAIALAPLPHDLDIRPPAVETAPPPREVQPQVSLLAPSEVFASAIAAAKEPLVLPEPAMKACETPVAAAVENILDVGDPPAASGISWGWFGALIVAISTGGYWMLHHSRIAREAKPVGRVKTPLLLDRIPVQC